MTSQDDAGRHSPPENETVIQRACAAVRSGRHTIIAGDLLLDRHAIVADIVAELRSAGLVVIDRAAHEQPVGPVSVGAVFVVDAATMTPDTERECTALIVQRGVTLILAMPSADPAGSAARLAQRLRSVHATEIVLTPLTGSAAQSLVEACAGEHGLELAPVEKTWMIAICGGSAPLLRAIVHDYAESDGTAVAVFGRRTRVCANEALAEIPPALIPTAQLVASLPGISRVRLRQFIDARALDLLIETPIARRCEDTIVITPAVVLALGLTAPTQLDEVAVLIASDVVSSLALGTACTEPEILLVARLLREHPRAFAELPQPDRARLLFVAMWLLRRAGVSDQAAFVARQLMAQPGWQDVSVLRSIARGQPEDLNALSADLRAGAFPREAYDVTAPWVQCLSLPLTRDTASTRWAVDFADAPTVSAADAAILAALRTVLRAAQAVQEHDLDRARALATEILLPEGAHDATRLRALIILGASASLAADGTQVERFVQRILGIVLTESKPGLNYSLARRGLDDALLLAALALASLGAPSPADFRDALDARILAAALADDHPALIRVALARLTVERDASNVAGTLRFLGRLTRTDLSAWAMGGFRGDAAPGSMHLVSGTFMDHAIAATRLLGTLALRGPHGLRAHWDTFPQTETPLRTICAAYLDLVHQNRVPSTELSVMTELTLPAQSLLGAMRDHVVGMTQSDPTVLSRALRAFIANQAWECARVANRDLATLTADDPVWAKQVKADQRLLQSAMSTVAAAQATLTPRERQIIQLASQGLRNKQIAEQLFVSVRTVESHLYRALHKLSDVGFDNSAVGSDDPPADSVSAPSAPG